MVRLIYLVQYPDRQQSWTLPRHTLLSRGRRSEETEARLSCEQSYENLHALSNRAVQSKLIETPPKLTRHTGRMCSSNRNFNSTDKNACLSRAPI